MFYVGGWPTIGRVGHQFSHLFAARHLAFMSERGQYLHTDLVDGPAFNDAAAGWNGFLGEFADIPRVSSQQHKSITLKLYRPLPPDRLVQSVAYPDIKRLVAETPDDWLLLCADWGLGWWEGYHWPGGTFTQTAQFFQQEMFQSRFFHMIPTIWEDAPGPHVVCYRRTPGTSDKLGPSWETPDAYFFSAWDAVKKRFGLHKTRPVLFTQGPRELYHHSDWKAFDIHVIDDEYPGVFTAMKSCMLADVFIGSLGGTNSLIRTMRHQQSLSIGLEGRAAYYPDGPNVTRSGVLDLQGFSI